MRNLIELDIETTRANPYSYKLLILCSPHNPVGRVWSQETITTIAELCKKYNVCLVADEIHSDLCRQNQSFYSACQLPENLTEIV